MKMKRGEKIFGTIYFAIFGVIVLAFGIAELIATAAGGITWGSLEMSGMFLPWIGVITICAGLFYLSSVKNFADIYQVAKATMASIMIWIVAGINIWAMIAGSIPGGEEGPWFNTWEGFIECYAGPYIPELFLLLPSLVIIYYILRARS